MISEADAARFLTQATFGTRLADIQQLQSLGYEGWLNKQFALQGGPHRDYVQRYYNPSGRASSRNLKTSGLALSHDCKDAEGRAPKVGALDDVGAVAEE